MPLRSEVKRLWVAVQTEPGVEKSGTLALTHRAIMESVAFLRFLEMVTCGMFSDMAALFLAGSLLPPGTLGEERRNYRGEDRMEHQILCLPNSRTRAVHLCVPSQRCCLSQRVPLLYLSSFSWPLQRGLKSFPSSDRHGADKCWVHPKGVC